MTNNRVLEILGRMEKKLDGDEKFRDTMTTGISDCQTRLTRIESVIQGSGGIVGRSVCRAREAEVDRRLASVENEQERRRSHIILYLGTAVLSLLAASVALIVGLSKIVKS